MHAERQDGTETALTDRPLRERLASPAVTCFAKLRRLP